jgi:hypothetical protein
VTMPYIYILVVSGVYSDLPQILYFVHFGSLLDFVVDLYACK